VLTCTIVNRAQPRLVVSKQVMNKQKTVRLGQTVGFRITVKNRGPA
jgi:hypothetical protein